MHVSLTYKFWKISLSNMSRPETFGMTLASQANTCLNKLITEWHGHIYWQVEDKRRSWRILQPREDKIKTPSNSASESTFLCLSSAETATTKNWQIWKNIHMQDLWFFGRTAFVAHVILPIATHFFVAWSVVCHIRALCLNSSVDWYATW